VPVEVGEVDVLARPPDENGAAPRADAPAAPAGPPPPAELERALALLEARDLRLCAD
jgi:hypothetical protein